MTKTAILTPWSFGGNEAESDEYGEFTRSMIVSVFNVSEITATRDIREYTLLGSKFYRCNSSKVFKACTDFRENPKLWNCRATPRTYLEGLELVYGIRIGVKDVPTFGIHKD